MPQTPLTVAWFSSFPVEWMPDAPDEVRRLPRRHPSSWQRVLLEELENVPGLRLHVIALDKIFERSLTFDRRGTTLHLIKTRRGWRAPTLFWSDTWIIRRKLREIRPDAVHAWGTERGGALIASRLPQPTVVTIQGLIGWYKEVVPLNRHDRFAAWLEHRSLPRARVVSTESTFSVNWLRGHYPGLRVEQVEHAPARAFHQVVRRPQTRPRRFLFVGSFDFRKGADLIIAALEQLRGELDFELIVVGKPDEGLWQNLGPSVSAPLRERLQFKPDLTPEMVAEELACATLLLCPTRADTSPNSVKEAVVAGVPVVASAVGGIPDYVWPGRNGVLFPSQDLNAFVRAVREACHHPKFGQGEVDANALAEARAYLAPRRMAEGFMRIYRNLAGIGERD